MSNYFTNQSDSYESYPSLRPHGGHQSPRPQHGGGHPQQPRPPHGGGHPQQPRPPHGGGYHNHYGPPSWNGNNLLKPVLYSALYYQLFPNAYNAYQPWYGPQWITLFPTNPWYDPMSPYYFNPSLPWNLQKWYNAYPNPWQDPRSPYYIEGI